MIDTLRLIHTICAALSITGFVLRGIWMLRSSRLLASRVVRIAPHVIDTLFLVSGIWLLLAMHYSLLKNEWLIAKLIALIVYIVLGTIALRRGPTRAIRAGAFVLAIATFIYIVGVALAKSPASWLAA